MTLFLLLVALAAVAVLATRLGQRSRELQALQAQVAGTQAQLERFSATKAQEVQQFEANAQKYKNKARTHAENADAKGATIRDLGDQVGRMVAELERYRAKTAEFVSSKLKVDMNTRRSSPLWGACRPPTRPEARRRLAVRYTARV